MELPTFPESVLRGSFSSREAWVDLHALREGGVEMSVREFAKRWKWKKSTAQDFIRLYKKVVSHNGLRTPCEVQFGLALPGVPPVQEIGLRTPTKAQMWPPYDKLKVERNGRKIYPDPLKQVEDTYTPDYHAAVKKDAYRHLRKAVLSGVPIDQVVKGIKNYINYLNETDSMPKSLHGFLRAGAWEDYDEYSDDHDDQGPRDGTEIRGLYQP